MRHGFLTKACAAIGLVTLTTSPSSAVQGKAPGPSPFQIVWDKTYGSDVRSTEFRAITTADNGDVFVAASERDALDRSAASPIRLLFWRIDVAGRLVSETEIRKTRNSKGTNSASVRDVVALGNGQALLLVDFEAGRPAIVRLDRNGKQTVTKELGRPGGGFATLLKIVPAPGGKFLLIGHESFDGLLIEVDAAGNLLWETTDDRGKMEYFVDGIATADGGFVLVGNSGQYDATRSGPSTVWVGRYDARGVLSTETTFPGRYGAIVRTSTGGYAVAYDQSSKTNQEIRLKILTADLKPASEAPILDTTTANFSEFKITPAGAGFIIGGRNHGRSYVTIVDERGLEPTTFQGETAPGTVDLGYSGLTDTTGGSFVLANSHIVVPPVNTPVRQKVRLQKVAR